MTDTTLQDGSEYTPSTEDRADALEAQIALSTDLPNRCEMVDVWTGEECGDDATTLTVLDSPLEPTPINVFLCPSCRKQKAPAGVEVIEPSPDSRLRKATDSDEDTEVDFDDYPIGDYDRDELDEEEYGCTRPGCESDADAIYTNGVFIEPRCEDHAEGDHVSVVREL